MTPFSTLEVFVLSSVLLLYGAGHREPTSLRATTSPLSNSNPAPVYVRAAAGTSPVVACPPAATHRGQVHQLINPFLPGYSCNILPVIANAQDPLRPAKYAPHLVPPSPNPIWTPRLIRAEEHRCTGALENAERFPSAFTIPQGAPRPRKRGDTETCFAGESDPAGMAS